LWRYVGQLAPDLALLQEVMGVPSDLATRYQVVSVEPITTRGTPQRFRTVILSRDREPLLGRPATGEARIDEELNRFQGHLPLVEVPFPEGSLRAVNVYSPAWPIPRESIAHHDWADVKLTLSTDVWVGDLLWKFLSYRDLTSNPWIVGGDFNLSETFDSWPGGPRGNREYLDRMEALGFTECLRASAGKLTPTFRNPRGGHVKHQVDHLFVTTDLAARLEDCRVGDENVIFGKNLSDHLPIIADFQAR
jgi:exonuclease III